MYNGPLAADLRCFNRNGPGVWQHNRKRYAGDPQVPTRSRANKECACEKLTHLAILDRDIEGRESIENNEDNETDRQRQDHRYHAYNPSRSPSLLTLHVAGTVVRVEWSGKRHRSNIDCCERNKHGDFRLGGHGTSPVVECLNDINRDEPPAKIIRYGWSIWIT